MNLCASTVKFALKERKLALIFGNGNVRRFFVTKVAQEPFLNGASSVYVEEMYKAWLVNPNSVHQVGMINL